MQPIAIERMSLLDGAAVAKYFAAGPAHPCIITDAVTDWPAYGKWNFEFFSSNFYNAMGLATLSFTQTSAGKTTKLGLFIDHLDDPYFDLPGFWIGTDGKPAASAPDFDEARVWSFLWNLFRKHPELRDDIAPFPAAIPNLTASLPRDISEGLERLEGVDFFDLYISRKDTITPLHTDFHHTIGCLVQFEGTKKVVLFAPGDYESPEGPDFDPENPDYQAYPAMLGRLAHSAVLEPGEMLIIPPDWWHYTRSQAHSMTLSHNFFTDRNLAAYLRGVRESIRNHPDRLRRFERVQEYFQPPAEIALERDA